MTRRRDQGPFDPISVVQMARGVERPIDAGDLDVLFAAALRSRSFFDETRTIGLGPQCFLVHEAAWTLLWQAMCRFADNYQQPFVYRTLYELLRDALQGAARLSYSQEQLEELMRCDDEGILYAACHVPADQVHVEYARAVRQRFMEERTVYRPIQQFVNGPLQGPYASGLPQFMAEMQQHISRVSAAEAHPRIEAVPALGTLTVAASVFHLTGLPFVDSTEYGLGGQREGDVNGLIGPTGGGKSTLGRHLLVSMSRLMYAQALTQNTLASVPMTALLTYEEPLKKARPSIWSTAMQIRRSKLDTMTSTDALSTPETIENYERQMAPGGEPTCERDRWLQAMSWLNRILQLYDMSGCEEFPNAGRGGVPEMVQTLDRECQQQGRGFRTIVIDYAKLVVQRSLNISDSDDGALRNALTNFGDELRRQIAERFGCTVWVIHQLKGAAGDYSPTKLMTHTDAADSKSFAVNMATCGCLGTVDKRTGCRRLNWSKVRFVDETKVRPVTLKIDERFAMMVDVGHQYGIDETGRAFTERGIMDRIEGHRQPAPPISSGSDGMEEAPPAPYQISAEEAARLAARMGM